MNNQRRFKLLLAAMVSVAIGANVGFAQTNVALGKPVTLNGAPFFTDGWGGGLLTSADTVVDGIFFPRATQWDQGPVWWDSHDGEARWIEIDLGMVYVIESLVVQSDDNDGYTLYYWDIGSSSWQVAWDVPTAPDYGMQTRPNPLDDTERYDLPAPIITNALKYEGASPSDMHYSVSEIQAFGTAVDVDIKPTSCPNPLNVKSKGVLPVAILGTADFDITTIDPATILLEGVAPLRWDWEDVATPFNGDKDDCYDCTREGPDGVLDLTLKFDRQEIVAALGDVEDGDCMVLFLEGEQLDGTPIVGQDVVVILKKGKK